MISITDLNLPKFQKLINRAESLSLLLRITPKLVTFISNHYSLKWKAIDTFEIFWLRVIQQKIGYRLNFYQML